MTAATAKERGILLEGTDGGREAGEQLHRFAAELYPICRSITGNGLRATLDRIGERIPLQIAEVPSGTEVFDWKIPREWNIRDAYIRDKAGKRVVDFQQCNLHVVNYSSPVEGVIPMSTLREHLFSLPDRPDWIPYRTSYYQESWGFCLSHRQLQTMTNAEYEVRIDSTLEEGSLTYGECFLPGRSEEEVLFSSHVCHPSLANDNLSGIVVATALAEILAGCELRYSYRFIFAPGTIGAITWLARNQERAKSIRHGLILSGVGDAGQFHYKKSRRGNAEIDRAMAHLLRQEPNAGQMLEFTPSGYDERQYCSPGFNLPVGCLMRTVWGTYPEYHTSGDNLGFLRPQSLAGSLRLCLQLVDVLERNRRYRSRMPYGEPQLGRRNLYRPADGKGSEEAVMARLWVLNLADGDHSLLDVAERSGLAFAAIADAAEALCAGGLLFPVEG